MRWVSFANVNTVDVPLLERMREAGCTTVSFGLESGNREILKTVKKGTRPEGMIAAVKACAQAGVEATGSFIIGLPGETEATLAETLAFSEELTKLGAATGFHMLAPFPGTAVREQADHYQLKIFTHDWSQYHANHAITETPGAPRAMQEVIAKNFEGKGESLFWELAARVERGTASQEEQARYARIERTGIYADIMLHDLVETRGSFVSESAELDPERAITWFAAEVRKATQRPAAAVEQAIRHGLEHGLLEYRTAHGEGHFRFKDSVAALDVTEVARTTK